MDNLGNIFEILASIIGILLYWLLTARKPKPKKKSPSSAGRMQPPTTQVSAPETMRDQDEIDLEEEMEKRMLFQELEEEQEEVRPRQPEIRTFKDLLEQFQVPEREVRQVQEIEEDASSASLRNEGNTFKQTDDLTKFVPESPFDASLNSSGVERNENYKIVKKKKSRIAKKFQNPSTVRDLFIAKEIFDRKHF